MTQTRRFRRSTQRGSSPARLYISLRAEPPNDSAVELLAIRDRVDDHYAVSPSCGSIQTVTRPRAHTSMQLVLTRGSRPSGHLLSIAPLASCEGESHRSAQRFRDLLGDALFEAAFADEHETALQPLRFYFLHD